jgi:NAD(P)-dependent dehydrogenase (short-subunit alcohol dehydrogenase family)
MSRLVMHVDIDAFFAAVEQRDNPPWHRLPLVVGAEPGRRGVVATCSYEARHYGVNVSSGMGQLSELNGCCPGYRLSKTALNAVTRILADELLGTGVKVNAVCPGWVRTDMDGPDATLSVGEGTRGIVWAATLPEDGPSGGFFRHGEPIDW